MLSSFQCRRRVLTLYRGSILLLYAYSVCPVFHCVQSSKLTQITTLLNCTWYTPGWNIFMETECYYVMHIFVSFQAYTGAENSIRLQGLPSITFPVHFRRFHKLRKTTIKIVMAVSPSVHLSAQKNPPPARRM